MPRILFATDVPPWPPTNGSFQRSNLIHRALREVGDVDLVMAGRGLTLTPEAREALTREFNMVGELAAPPRHAYQPWATLHPLAPKLVEWKLVYALGRKKIDYQPNPQALQWLSRRMAECQYDVIVGRCLSATCIVGALNYQPVIVDIDDLDTQKVRSKLDTPSKFRQRLHLTTRYHLRQLRNLVPRRISQCARAWVVSADDQRELGFDHVSLLPNVPFTHDSADPPACPPRPGSRVLLTVAVMDWGPNERGIDHFVTRVWPRVRAACPHATFRIVGKNMFPEQRQRWGAVPGVEPVGFVENLTAEYDRCAFAVATVFQGGGSKIKVLEALGHQRTCVVTEHSHRGYEHVLLHRQSLWAGYTDEAFADGCIHLLKHPEEQAAMAAVGRSLVLKHFSYRGFRDIVKRDVAAVMATPQGALRPAGQTL